MAALAGQGNRLGEMPGDRDRPSRERLVKGVDQPNIVGANVSSKFSRRGPTARRLEGTDRNLDDRHAGGAQFVAAASLNDEGAHVRREPAAVERECIPPFAAR